MRRHIPVVIICFIIAGPLVMFDSATDRHDLQSPWSLLILLCLLLWPLRQGYVLTLQKLTATYMVALSIDYLGGTYWHLRDTLQVAASLLAVGAVAVAVVCDGWRRPQDVAARQISWAAGIGMAVIVIHLVVVGLLIHAWYGYGTQRSLPVLGQLAMVLLVGMMAWRLSNSAVVRVGIGITGILCYGWMTVS